MVFALSGCLESEETVLEGERLRLDGSPLQEQANNNIAAPFSVPQAEEVTDWAQRPGATLPWVPNPALASVPAPVWRTPIGAGNARGQRIVASPVVADGLVFVMDARTRVSAFDASSGKPQWVYNLSQGAVEGAAIPAGGIAHEDGKLFVTDGFGKLTALNATTGSLLWVQDLDTIAGPAVISRGIAYVTGRDGSGWAINTENGRVLWSFASTPSAVNLLRGPSPAVSENLAVFAFASGEVAARFRVGGLLRWSLILSGEREGPAYARISDIPGDPVIAGDRVYVGNHSGQVVALSLAQGWRLWTVYEGANTPVWPAGDSVFMITDEAVLIRLNATDGAQYWRQDLRTLSGAGDAPAAYFGPVLAGGLIRVPSSQGGLLSFDPVSGELVSTVEIEGGAASTLAVANGTAYIVSQQGELFALR